jgi:uncharacterized protein YlaI
MEKKEFKIKEERVRRTSSITYFCDGCGKRIGTKSYEVKDCTSARKPVQFYKVFSYDTELRGESDYCLDCIASAFTKFLDKKDEFAGCYEFEAELREIKDTSSEAYF